MKTLQELETEMDQYLMAGEIPNARYQEIKSNLSRLVYKEGKEMYAKSGWRNPWYITSLPAFQKLLNKYKYKEDTVIDFKIAQSFSDKYLPLAEKLKQLKPMVVKRGK